MTALFLFATLSKTWYVSRYLDRLFLGFCRLYFCLYCTFILLFRSVWRWQSFPSYYFSINVERLVYSLRKNKAYVLFSRAKRCKRYMREILANDIVTSLSFRDIPGVQNSLYLIVSLSEASWRVSRPFLLDKNIESNSLVNRWKIYSGSHHY